MKNILKIAFALLVTVIIFQSCRKNAEEKIPEPTKEEVLQKKISEIIPQKYIDTLKKMGLVFNEGTTPANVEGRYVIVDPTLVQSNTGDPLDVPGRLFTTDTIKLANQDLKTFAINVFRSSASQYRDTSIITAISGNGNKVTIYGKTKSIAANKVNSAIIAMVISAEKNGSELKNYTLGIINIDNSNGGNHFLAEGKGRIIKDPDAISPLTTVAFAPQQMQPFSLGTSKNLEDVLSHR